MNAEELGNRPASEMTYRQELAARAMHGLLAQKYDHGMRMYEGWRDEFANEAYRFADAILAREAQEAGDERG